MHELVLEFMVNAVLLDKAVHSILALKLQVVVILVLTLSVASDIRHTAVEAPLERWLAHAVVHAGGKLLIHNSFIVLDILNVLKQKVTALVLQELPCVIKLLRLDRWQ